MKKNIDSKLFNLKNKKIFLKMISYESKTKNISKYTDPLVKNVYFDKKTKTITSNRTSNSRWIVKNNDGKYMEYKNYISSLKKLDKLLKEAIDFSDDLFICSTIKKTSNILNAKMHAKNDFFLSIDLKNYFENVSFFQIKNILECYLNISSDLSAMISEMLTVKNPKGKRVLPQGFPTSPFIALLCTYNFFKSLNDFSNKKGMKFSVYVDDLTFSKKIPISEKIIKNIFKIISNNSIKINRKKVFIKKVSMKHDLLITGINFKSDKIFPFFKSDKYNQKGYMQKMKTILNAIGKYNNKKLTYGILKTLLEPYNKNGEKMGSLFKQYLGYYYYIHESEKIVPNSMKNRRFRTWEKNKSYFEKQKNEISSINSILSKKVKNLNNEDIKKISLICNKIWKNAYKKSEK